MSKSKKATTEKSSRTGVTLVLTPEFTSSLQPSIAVEYTCVECGKGCKSHQQKPGFLPRYCEGCAKTIKKQKQVERVQRWRANHPELAKVAAKKANDLRRKKE